MYPQRFPYLFQILLTWLYIPFPPVYNCIRCYTYPSSIFSAFHQKFWDLLVTQNIPALAPHTRFRNTGVNSPVPCWIELTYRLKCREYPFPRCPVKIKKENPPQQSKQGQIKQGIFSWKDSKKIISTVTLKWIRV